MLRSSAVADYCYADAAYPTAKDNYQLRVGAARSVACHGCPERSVTELSLNCNRLGNQSSLYR